MRAYYCGSLVFQRSGHHQDLHSFPTRRSSDLLHAGEEVVLGVPDPALPGLQRRQRGDDVAAAFGMLRDPRLEDRKSTRLNSSHVSISYAVFCLKKKNETIYISLTCGYILVLIV